MPKRAAGLTAAKVKTLTKPGRYADGGGLYLLTRETGAKFWVFRYMRDGKAREMGLGPASGPYPVGLAEARGKAGELVAQLRAGVDPMAAKEAHKERRKAEQAEARGTTTFKEAAEKYIAAHEAGWKNPVHAAQWPSTLAAYAYPVIGDLPVAAITTGHLTKILEPIWQAKTETATRVRGRIEKVLDFAKVHGWRSGENPARWTGHLSNILPAKSKIAKAVHHAALPYADLPALMGKLGESNGVAARCLRLLILTATRSNEARGATWAEIDLKGKVWVIPGTRMKAGQEHRVPLSEAVLAILNEMALLPHEPKDLVFPGQVKDKPLSDVALAKALKTADAENCTVHGMRSTFRDWCAERTNYPREICEAALAHATGNAVELAYKRTDLLEKRRKLMDAWAAYATGPVVEGESGNVIPLQNTV